METAIETDGNGKVLIDEICPECGNETFALVDGDALAERKAGRVKCPVCGRDVFPCHECQGRDCDGRGGCDACAWKNAEYARALTDGEYRDWCRKNDPKAYAAMQAINRDEDGSLPESECDEIIAEMDALGYAYNDALDDGRVEFADREFTVDSVAKGIGASRIIRFEDWKSAKEYVESVKIP